MPLKRSPAPELLAHVHQYEQLLLSRCSVYQFFNASKMFHTYQFSSILVSVLKNYTSMLHFLPEEVMVQHNTSFVSLLESHCYLHTLGSP